VIKDFESKLKFIELIDKMKNIERASYLISGRRENNAEHSFHLAMMALIFSEDFSFLNIEKCIKLSLVHDIIEIYAWDTIFLVDNIDKIKSKKDREHKALLKMKKLFSEYFFDDINNLIIEYESSSTPESKFVHQLDKIQPIIQYVMEWWKWWHKWKFDKNELLLKYEEIFKKDEFWLKKIVDYYFQKAEKENMFYEK